MDEYVVVKSASYNEKLKQHLAGGVHYNFRTLGAETAIHFSGGDGSFIRDLDGNDYLDLYCKFGAMILGHNNAAYKNELHAQVDKVIAVNHSDIDLEAAVKIQRHMPSLELVRFGLSGTEMIQNAIRLARAHAKRNKFIRFEGHYHGNMDNIMGGKMKGIDHPVPVEFPGDPRFTSGRAEGIMEDQSFILPWNNFELLEKIVKKHNDEIAAIIMEPICINGGGIMPAPGYLESVRTLCDKTGIVLIFDEVITGFRVDIGGAQNLLGVIPDLTVMGKAIAGGMPVSLLGGKKEIMKRYVTREVIHAGTFNGYPLGLAAVKSTVSLLEAEKAAAYPRMKRIGLQLCETMKRVAERYDIPFVYQGPGPVLIFHCTEKPLEKADDLTWEIQTKDSIVNRCFQKYGVLISPVSRIFTNILSSENDVSFIEERLDDAFKDAKIMFKEFLGK